MKQENKRENSFRISLEREFIIYGASFIGRELYNGLSGQGYKVVAFLDRDAHKFENTLGAPILVPDDDAISNSQKESAVVIVAITNHQEHRFVAAYLNKLGYKNLVFRTDSSDDKYFTNMNQVYDLLKAGRPIEGILIANNEQIDTNTLFDSNFCRNVGENTYHIFIPAELLFYEKNNRLISVYQATPLLPFYNFLEGKETEEFLRCCFLNNPSNNDWERWMEEERNYFKHFSLNSGFNNSNSKSLPKVGWDGEGRFIVQDSLRSVIYSISKNYSKILCSMSKAEYEKWINRDKLDACLYAINEGNLSFVYTPIPHPAFYNFPCKREECGKTRLLTICEYLYKNNIDIKGKRVLDVGSYVCYFSQHMYRMGADVTAIEIDKTSYCLADNLNKLLYCDGINHLNCGIQEIDKSVKYDITFLFTVLYWHLHTELALEIIKTIDSVTKDILFWESGNESEFEKNWILEHSSFIRYEKICNTFGTGKFRELGVFLRE